jgi:hypothetical protein
VTSSAREFAEEIHGLVVKNNPFDWTYFIGLVQRIEARDAEIIKEARLEEAEWWHGRQWHGHMLIDSLKFIEDALREKAERMAAEEEKSR